MRAVARGFTMMVLVAASATAAALAPSPPRGLVDTSDLSWWDLPPPPPAPAASPPNASFDAPDLSWWDLPSSEGVNGGWSEFGNPGGSLYIETAPIPSGHHVFAWGPCVTGPEGRWEVWGDVLGDSGRMECRVNLILYTGQACETGPIGKPSQDMPPDVWVPRYDREAIRGSIRSLRLALIVAESDGGRCYFDNLVLRGPREVPGIPTSSPVGLAVLAGLLVGAAVVALRRLG